MKTILSIVLTWLACSCAVMAQAPGGVSPMVPVGGGVSPSGAFTAGDLIAGSGTTSVQDSANCSTFCALPNRFQVGSSTSATALWPDTVITGTSTATQLYAITTGAQDGYIAGAFNTRTSDAVTDGGGVTEGVQILTLNDRTTGTRNAWGLYIQAMFTTTLAGTQLFGQEVSISNANTKATEDPFGVNTGKFAHALRLDCIDANTFGQGTSNQCQNAMDIVLNGKAFSSGVVFQSTALDTSVFTNPPAISLPSGTNGYGIFWYSAAATPEWEMYGIGTSGNAKKITLGSTLLSILDSTGTVDFNVSVATGGQMQVGSSSGTNCGNYVQIFGAANGTPAQIAAAGCSDSNTTLRLAGKTNLGGVQITGHFLTRNTSAAPALGTCGTGSVNAASTDNAGLVTATGATSCAITFNVAYTNTPFCWVSDNTTAAGLKVVTTTAGITVTGLTSGDVFSYGCTGQAGG